MSGKPDTEEQKWGEGKIKKGGGFDKKPLQGVGNKSKA